MFKPSLRNKLLSIVVVALIVGFGVLSMITIKRSTATLNNEERAKLELMAIGLVKSIQQIMTSGNALLALNWAIDIKGIKEMESLEIIRITGEEGFHDNYTIDDVNARLGADVFQRRTQVTEDTFVSDVDKEKFQEVVEKGIPVSYIKEHNDRGSLTLLYPIHNEERCHGCHGGEKVLRAVLRLSSSTDKVKDAITSARREIGLISLSVVMAVGCLLVYSITRMVIKPIHGLMDVMTSVASGDLTKNSSYISRDEIGELSRETNQVIANLHGMIGKIDSTSEGITHTARKVAEDSRNVATGSSAQAASIDNIVSTMEEMNASIAEIAKNTAVLASSAQDGSSAALELEASISEVVDGAEKLFVSVEETTSSIIEMSASIKEVSENTDVMADSAARVSSSITEMNASIQSVDTGARETTKLAETVIGDANAGMTAVERTIEGVGRIKGLTHEAMSIIKGLGKSIEEAGKILSVIREVADNTHLLSLNATILAAQAREHGKGFAVVAEEIGELAERTRTSAKEVADIIEAMQSEGFKTTGAMERIYKAVEEGGSLSSEAGEALKRIVEGTRASTDKVREIAGATLEQSKATADVMKATEKVAQMAERIAIAAGDQSRGSEQISKASERMKDIASMVRKATRDQAEANKQITMTLNKFVNMVESINMAIKEQNTGISQILKATEDVRSVAKENNEKAAGTSASVEEMRGQAVAMAEDVKRFKLEENKKRRI